MSNIKNTLKLSSALYLDFLSALKNSQFSGEINDDYANRIVLATDNSIYQRIPQAVVYPVNTQDLQQLARLMAQPEFQEIVVAPRGGGTGTNGQSLTDGIVVDVSRHMNKILEINAQEGWARVEAGVVKDQLNAAVKPDGFFFAPELSTSNRATIGGMVSTDASGQGSCVYGKTRDHVIELKTVLIGGDVLETQSLSNSALQQVCAQPSTIGNIYRTVSSISKEQSQLIKDTFPPLNRCLTGYDLAHLQETNEHFNLNSILCGAEGTLGFLTEAKVNLQPIPHYSVLVNIRYRTFMDALRDAKTLMERQPLSIETVDSKVLMLAKQDSVWQSVAEYFPEDEEQTLGINLVEFSGQDIAAVTQDIEKFLAFIDSDNTISRIGYTLAEGETAVKTVYAMRKRAVGLLGNVQGEARPQPFIEDMAVPPEHLADFIAQLRDLLDSHDLQYGMFGHVDAGVLHVRPLLDMKDPKQAQMIRPITDAAVRLIEEYGGLLWGEHGKGMRAEYSPKFFGALYPAIQQVKAAFDPFNQLNPGKIATPLTKPKAILLKIDQVPLRGEFDREIPTATWQSYGASMHCNGNGACFNYDPNDAMCPSWKATRQRIHSPKGRASLMKEWLRLEEQAPSNHDFSDQVYQAMSGCLACKSCVGQCPVKVDIPELRSRFLNEYHQKKLRPLRDYVIASLEFTMPYLAKVRILYNSMVQQPWIAKSIKRLLGMVDTPLISTQRKLTDVINRWAVKPATVAMLENLNQAEQQRSVILVQDVFTRYFDSDIVADFIELAARLGYLVWLSPLKPNGKPLHVQGFRNHFAKAAKKNSQGLVEFAELGIPLVGLDPAMTLVYRQEYTKVIDDAALPKVLLPQEWLLQVLPATSNNALTYEYRLLSHCTEKTNAVGSVKQWQQLFARRGLTLTTPSVGCCGMSGTYGHEARNLATSQTIFQQSWQQQLNDASNNVELLATGYSCRSQVKRFEQQQLKHPIQALLASVEQEASI